MPAAVVGTCLAWKLCYPFCQILREVELFVLSASSTVMLIRVIRLLFLVTTYGDGGLVLVVGLWRLL